MLGFDALKLDSNLFARDNIGACKWSVIDEGRIDTRYLTKVDVTETATANLTANTILVAHTKILDHRQWSVVCFEQILSAMLDPSQYIFQHDEAIS